MIVCIGDLVEDVIVIAPHGVRIGTDSPARVERHRGGSAANVAVAARVAGAASRFVGNVGTDPLGARLLGELEVLGVDVAVTRAGRTGTVVALIASDGERSFLTDRGSAGELTIDPPGCLAGASVVHVPLYSLLNDPMRTTTLAILDDARAARLPISLDASSTGAIEDAGVDGTRELIRRLTADVLFCNRDEAALLGVDVADRLATTTIVKNGAAPTTVLGGAGTSNHAVPPVDDVVDTTGAGDSFAAGYLAARYGRLEPLESAISAAHAIAARTIVTFGATPTT